MAAKVGEHAAWHSGVLDRTELKQALRMMGFRISDVEFGAVWRCFDADTSGRIDAREFIARLNNKKKDS